VIDGTMKGLLGDNWMWILAGAAVVSVVGGILIKRASAPAPSVVTVAAPPPEAAVAPPLPSLVSR
jgi:hypothetical protein